MKYKLILALMLLFFCSGCRDQHNIDELAIVLGMGIDRIPGPEPILLTVQVVVPGAAKTSGKESGGSEKPYIILTSTGKTLLEAVYKLSQNSSRTLFFFHDKIIILGEKLAAGDISEVMDYLERSREIRLSTLIMVAKPTAKEILESKIDLAKIPAMGIHALLTSRDQPFAYPVKLNDFSLNLKTAVGVSYAPLVALQDINKENSLKLAQAEGQPPKPEKTSAKVTLQGMAIFKDNHLAGVINEQDTQSLLWLLNKFKQDTVLVSSPDGAATYAVDIFKGDSTILPHLTPQGITMEIRCTANAELSAASTLSPQLKNLTFYNWLEQASAGILQTRMEQSISHAQKELQLDYLGFGNKIHNIHPVAWRQLKPDWSERFPEVNYTVTFQVKLRKVGISKGSALYKNSEE